MSSAEDRGGWPTGWQVDLVVEQDGNCFGWQADLSYEGERLCRLCVVNLKGDAAAAHAQARQEILEWIRCWKLRSRKLP
jgi:hypothetical protein